MGAIAFASVTTLVIIVNVVHSLDNGLGLTPQMAWNSWNTFGCSINEQVVRATAESVIQNGLNKAGYNYVNVDDCWAGSRNASGYVEPDPVAFPSGMKALADYVHSLGLKFGLYSDAGYKTCGGRPGSLGYETQDAQIYAEWGVDYLKYDNCNHPDNETDEVRTQVMRDALNKTGRPIFFSLCEGYVGTALFGPETGNSWRTTVDIGAFFESWVNNLDQNDAVLGFGGPGGWNDPDMLEVGNGNLTQDENIAHFSLWALVKAPLILGNDLRKLTPKVLDVITNPEIIEVSQDRLGKQGTRLSYTMATSNTAYGNILYAEACNGSPAQQFAYSNNTITARLNGLCVGQFSPLWGCSFLKATVGSALYLQECNSFCNGKFQNFTVDTASSTIQTNFGTLCAEANTTNGRNQSDIRLALCSSEASQTWAFHNGQFQNTKGQCLTVSRGDEAWGGPLQDGSYAVVLFNRASFNQSVTVIWSDLNIQGSASVRDLWAHENLGTFATSYSAPVNARGAVALKVTPV